MTRSIIIVLLATMSHDAWSAPSSDDNPRRGGHPSNELGAASTRGEKPGHEPREPSAREAELLRLEASEPSLAEVRQAALHYAGLDDRPESSYPRRARLSALLPTLTVEVDRDAGFDRGLSRNSIGTERLDLGNDGEIGVEIKASWRLDRLLFSDLELRAVKAAHQHHRERIQLLAQVTTLYFQRRKKQIAMLWSRGKASDQAALNRLAIAELTAQLDTLTGGGFTRMLMGKGARH